MEPTPCALAAPPEPGLAENLLEAAPVARAWSAATGAGARELALALDLGARLLQAAGPEALGLLRLGGPAQDREAASKKGARGEEEVYRLLSQARPLRDVTRRAHSCDFVFDTNAGPVFIEVKDYATAVPEAQVDKFLRDLRERDAAAGVLLSLGSPIAGVRAAFAVALDPRVSSGTLVPVVYAAPPRAPAEPGGRLEPSLALAAADVAAALAEAYPRGVRGLHGRDAALAHAAAADQLADGVAAVRTDLARALASCSGDLAALGERLVALGRSARELAAAQRAEAEEVRETTPSQAEAFAEELRARYPVRAAAEDVARVVRAIEDTAFLAGLLGEEHRWRLLKARAVHVGSGCALSFLKGATSVRVPLARLTAAQIGGAAAAHPQKTQLSDGELGLELDGGTVGTILRLLDSA